MDKRYPEVVYRLLNALRIRPDVQAIAVVGSYASGTQRLDSDIDACVFYRRDLDVDGLADSICTEFALSTSDVSLTPRGGWGNWVDGGGWLTLEGQRVDVVYRCLERLGRELKRIQAGEIELDYLQAPAFGYFNFTWAAELQATDPLYDPDGRVADLIAQCKQFPVVLQEKCTSLFLHVAQFSADIGKKSLAREEWFTACPCCDRALWAVCVALYAANAVWMPAEKRVMNEIDTLSHVPNGFAERCMAIQKSALTAESFQQIDVIIQDAREQSDKALARLHRVANS